jgi:hypothetical protein
MVAFRIGDLRVGTLDDGAFATVLEAAAQAGGAARFPSLFTLAGSDEEIEPLAIVDEMAQLAATEPGRPVAHLIGSLRDDLMEALAAVDEG